MSKRRLPRSIDVRRLRHWWGRKPVVQIALLLGHSRGTLYRKAKQIGLRL